MNGVTLCYACHFFWAHKEPTDFTEWIQEYLGKSKYALLKRRSLKIKNYLTFEDIKFALGGGDGGGNDKEKV